MSSLGVLYLRHGDPIVAVMADKPYAIITSKPDLNIHEYSHEKTIIHISYVNQNQSS